MDRISRGCTSCGCADDNRVVQITSVLWQIFGILASCGCNELRLVVGIVSVDYLPFVPSEDHLRLTLIASNDIELFDSCATQIVSFTGLDARSLCDCIDRSCLLDRGV